MVCGRRSGKTQTAALLACYLAAFVDWTAYLGPGDIATVMCIACDKRQARTMMRYMTGLLTGSPVLAQEVVSISAERIELRNRVAIEIHAGNFRSVRGYAIPVCILDEAAFFRSEGSALPADELVKALDYSLASIPGSMLIGLSSPHSRRGILWERHRDHYGHDDSDVLIWQAPSDLMNPRLSAAALARRKAADPIAFRTEIEAQFAEDISQHFADADLDAAQCPDVRERPPILHLPNGTPVEYRAFTDPSGGRHDGFTLAIAHADGHDLILDHLSVTRPPFDPESVVRRYAEQLQRYRLASVQGDRYAAEWVSATFGKYGIGYAASERDKSAIYSEVMPAFAERRVRLLDHDRLLTELRLLERRPRPGGRGDVVDHPPRASDDAANSCCGALLMVAQALGPPITADSFFLADGDNRSDMFIGSGYRAGLDSQEHALAAAGLITV